MNDFILQTRSVAKSFGGLTAVNRVDFGLSEGNLHAIIGPNGAGKTTFFNLITGFFPPDEGKILYKGEEITGLKPHKIVEKGVVRSFQVAAIYPLLTVTENIQIVLFSKGGETYHFFKRAKTLRTQKVYEILDNVGLMEEKDVAGGQLSHGDRKRLELAMVMAIEPKVMLLDEPTAGMSPDETRQIMDLIKKINGEQGLSILFTEHDMSVVFGIAKRITVLHQGKILAEGSLNEVKNNRTVQNIYLGEDAI